MSKFASRRTVIANDVADPAITSARAALARLVRGWPGAALAVDAHGLIIAASSLSGYAADMRAPFDTPPGLAPAQLVDASGRRWRISAAADGCRLAIADPKETQDAAHRFTAAVSHEIRTPLNGILGMASLLEEGELSPAQRDYAANIRKSGARLLDLLNNVLDYSRLEAGEIPLIEAAFDPAELVQDVAELLAPRAHGAGLDLAAMVDPATPPRLMGDAGRIRQVLFNLTGNAVKFTETGGVLIEVRPLAKGEGIAFIVRDTGRGIPEDARARLFEAFGQVSAADAGRDNGVGLGLAIVARLVQAMKGRIEVISQPGEGAMFRVELPLCCAGIEGQPVQRLAGRPRIALHLPPASCLAAASALVPTGARIEIEAERADLHLVDAALAPARIAHLASHKPTLVVLRPEDRSRIETFRKLGCAGYLIRPLRSSSIAERVRLALAGERAVEPDEAALKPGAGAAVLIADDNAVNALLARTALAAAGFRVDVVGTGAEALERAGETSYNVIFMDIRMPVMDGLEATRRIRRLDGPAGATPIVALTADVNPDLEARAREAGVSQVAAKPIDPPRLRELALAWTQRANAH